MTHIQPIAIHSSKGSFSDGWVEYCENNGIPFRLVDCFDSDIVRTLSDCSALMWHWSHNDASAAKFARQLIYSLEARGLPVFPNAKTSWHFDDKLGQKYLFEALAIPHVPSYAFYTATNAGNFIRDKKLPVVFKLARGAGSKNVVLVENLLQAKRIINRCFGRGWPDRNRAHAVKEKIWQYQRDRNVQSALGILKGFVRSVVPHPSHRTKRVESSYAYFQDFIDGNDSDVRVIVIGGKAVAIKRMTRLDDFRASGSGLINYDPRLIPEECLRISFESAVKIGVQTAAFDFVMRGEEALVVEVSYGFSASAYRQCPGYWDSNLEWHDAEIVLEEIIMESFLTELDRTGSCE